MHPLDNFDAGILSIVVSYIDKNVPETTDNMKKGEMYAYIHFIIKYEFIFALIRVGGCCCIYEFNFYSRLLRAVLIRVLRKHGLYRGLY